MRRLALQILLPLLCLLAAVPLLAQSAADDAIAMQFYPPALDADFVADHDPNTPIYRTQTNMRFDFDFTGLNDYLAVAYSNGMSARLRLIKTSGAAPTLVAESTDATMGGRGLPLLDGYDVETDGVPEIVLTVLKTTWIYKYANNTLTQVEPTMSTPLGTTSALGRVLLLDMDGDCTLEMLEEAPADSDAPYVYYKLTGAGFQQYPNVKVEFADTFVAGDDGAIGLQSRHFDVPASGEYTITIAPLCGLEIVATPSALSSHAGKKQGRLSKVSPLAPPSGGGTSGLFLNGLKIMDESSVATGWTSVFSQTLNLQAHDNELSFSLSTYPGAIYAVTITK
ncbi:MAG: hypothetical protein JWN02_1686 [Acidobacteria bacterium]|nr:hypothetical protein [Acidobacteriota bacterium]